MQLLDEDSSYSLRQLAQRTGIGDYEVPPDTTVKEIIFGVNNSVPLTLSVSTTPSPRHYSGKVFNPSARSASKRVTSQHPAIKSTSVPLSFFSLLP